MSPGDVLDHRYVLEARLGRGGMGEVWRARRTDTRERVAVKMLREDLAADEPSRRRFLREARLASSVSHPNVIEMYDVLENEGAPFLVMELLAGETLGSRLRRKQKLGQSEAAAILLPVFDAVEAAHSAGIVHRDLKPENIFLARDGEAVQIRVLDFGIAKRTERLDAPMLDAGGTTAPLGTTGAMLGTPFYMSPEQALGERDIDARADLWSLGIILYECLSGKRPTGAETLGGVLKIIVTDGIVPLGEVAPELDAGLAREVMHLLRSDRAQRATSLRAVRATLEALQPKSAVLDLPEEDPPPRSAPAPVARRLRWPLVALVGVLGGGVIVVALAFSGGARTPTSATTSASTALAAPESSALPHASALVAVGPTPSAPASGSAAVAALPPPLRSQSLRPAASTAPSTLASPGSAAPAISRGPSGLVADNPFAKP